MCKGVFPYEAIIRDNENTYQCKLCKMKRVSLFILVSLLYINLVIAQEDIIIGKYQKLQSEILGGEVTYLQHLPDGYEDSDREYPVLYMMNGHIVSAFANAAATIDKLSYERIPDMILIGISNTGVARKYWSCPDDTGYVKNGEVFSRFLREEFIPAVQRNYRTNDFSVLAGQSNTGLFVMYQLLFNPELFNAYVVASPMFNWCPDFYFNETRLFLQDNSDVNQKLYVSYGDLDYVEVLNHIKDFEHIIKQSPRSVEWKLELIENSGHVPYATLNNALLYFFSECTMNAERKKLRISEIKSHFEKLSEEYGFAVHPKDGVLFDMAYNLKNQKKYDEAIEMFEYLISLYPDSATYYYVLGLTYQQKGETELAKESFNESLRINPEYGRAKSALEKLTE